MASLVGTRQACRLCRRRKVKCDGLPTCRNCHAANTPCQYSPPRKRGPKPVQRQDCRPREPVSSISPATGTFVGLESPALAVETDSSLSSNGITAYSPSTPPEIHTQTAARIHQDLLTRLSAAAPSDTPASITNHCIFLYTQYVFATVPMCHEATLRATASRFFVSPGDGCGPLESPLHISRCFAAENVQERIGALRNLTLLTALCAAVIYVLPESFLPNKHLTAPLFLQAARDMLAIYEDYDLEHPDSSSLGIRLFLSSAIQIAQGTQGVAFHILSEAGLIAMRMRLYDENSLEGREPVEENLLRNAFWQLYVCDKTAFVMKNRPVTIHESLFAASGLTLKTHSRSSMPLFEPERGSSGAGLEARLAEGFHVIRRLWATAARLIQAMEESSTTPRRTSRGKEDIAQLSEAYFEMITLTNWTQSSSPGDSSELPQILQRQRTSYLISLHCVKIFVLNSATQYNMTAIMGLRAEPLMLAMRQIEVAQDFLNVLETVPFLHLQTEGEHCAEKIRRVGSLLLEVAHTAETDVVKIRANQCAIRLIDMLARLDSKASDVLVQ